MAFSDWNTTAANNTTVGSINIGENCPPGNLNDAAREMMAELRQAINPALDAGLASGTVGQVTGTLSSIGALGTAADRLLYSTAPSTFAETPITGFARAMLDDGSAADVRGTIGAISVSAAVLEIPGYIQFSGSFGTFLVQWGTFSAAPNGTTSITYPAAFNYFSIPTVSGGTQDTGATDNDPFVSSAATSGFSVFSARNASVPCWWIAVGT